MAKGPSPLLGYNTNVRHKGKLYHIQTEDSGVNHPHIITHLFADGGRIVASKKTSYAEHVGLESYQDVVKKLMQQQHKAMFMALRDGIYDEVSSPPTRHDALRAPETIGAAVATARAPVDVDAFERAAARLTHATAGTTGPTPPNEAESPLEGRGLYQPTRSARRTTRSRAMTPPSQPPRSIFGGDLVSEKSLDEVILSYLAEDIDDPEP